MKLLVIVPAYNEGESIAALVKKLRQVKPQVDVVVINDASTDQTSFLAREAGAKVLDLPVNLGIGGAVQAGYLYAFRNQYDIAIQVDGDGQHDPAFIPDLIEPLVNSGADLVIGSRFLDYKGFQSSFMRRLGIGIIRGLIYLITGKKFTDPTSGFRASNRNVIAQFAKYYPVDYPEPESLVTISQQELVIVEKKVVMNARHAGQSSIKGFGSLYYMFKVCLAIIIERFKRQKVYH